MYNRDIEALIPRVFIHEDISESKYEIMCYYGGGIARVLTAVCALIVDDIKNRRFKVWWPKDEEILEHFDLYMNPTYTALYNDWALISSSGNDIRQIEWSVLERIYRNLIVHLWRRYINTMWSSVEYCIQVAWSETGGRTNQFHVSLVGIAVDEANGLFIARYNVAEYT